MLPLLCYLICKEWCVLGWRQIPGHADTMCIYFLHPYALLMHIKSYCRCYCLMALYIYLLFNIRKYILYGTTILYFRPPFNKNHFFSRTHAHRREKTWIKMVHADLKGIIFMTIVVKNEKKKLKRSFHHESRAFCLARRRARTHSAINAREKNKF